MLYPAVRSTMDAVTAGWENFFVAEAGASAALSGLLFVAVSINLPRILAFPHLPSRAAETLALLLSVLVTSTFGLIPHQSAAALGVELIATAVGLSALITSIQIASRKYKNVWNKIGYRVVTNQVPLLPTLAAGISLCAGARGGLLWLAPGALLCFCAGVFNTWVLLIEIQR